MEEEQFKEQSQEWIRKTSDIPSFQCEYDNATLFHNFIAKDRHEFELSVTYSHAFKTPVAYLRPVSHILSTSDILSLFPSIQPEYFSTSEHPTTSIPSYFLHPCNSADLLIGHKPLFTWISLILQMLNIQLSSDTLIRLFIV